MIRQESHKILKWGTGLFIVLFSIFLYYLNHLMPFLPGDDYLYQLKFSADGILRSSFIHSPLDLIESVYNHYHTYNNRVFPHLILQCILLLPHWIFDLLNTLVFLSIPLIVLSWKNIRQYRAPLISYAITLCLIWVFHFDLGRAYFWTTGSLNYSWMLIPQLLFLNGILNWHSSPGLRLHKSHILLAIIICTTNEHVVLSLSLIMTYFMATHIIKTKRAPDQTALLTLLILSLGGLIMLTSPALSLRLENEGAVYDDTLTRLIEYIKRASFYLISCLPLFLLLLFSRSAISLKLNKQQRVLISVYIISTLVMIAAPRFDARSAIFGFMLALMVLVRFKSFDQLRTPAIVLLIVISGSLIGIRTPLFQSLNERATANQAILDQSGTASDTVYLYPFCNSFKVSRCLVCDDLSDDPEHINNEPMAAYFNKEAITLKPEFSFYKQYIKAEAAIKTKQLTGYSIEEIQPVRLLKNHHLVQLKTRHGPSGSRVIFEIDGPALPEDYIIILRGSPKGMLHHRFIDFLPDKIKIYFLEHLEHHQPIIRDSGRSYAFDFLYNPRRYKYYVASLYSLNNHRPVGDPFSFNLSAELTR